jgi:NADH-quinone oxidoreductase subunit L
MFNALSIRTLLILIPLLPLAAALAAAVLGPRLLRQRSHWPVIVGTCGSFLLSLMLLAEIRSQAAIADPGTPIAHVQRLWTWMDSPDAVTLPGAAEPLDFNLAVTLRADPLTAIMLCMVTFVATLVAVFAAGYMHGDAGYWRFFAHVALFVFSMTMLVSVSNFLLLFVFWEAVGVCSYLLIGHWYQKHSASDAGLKAFLVNRVGDFGFGLGLLLMWVYYGTWDFHDTAATAGVLGQLRLSGAVPFVGGAVGLTIALSLMWGACGKSAQIPLHVWLPDAMEGPTPVSALIHAATMVTAGVYMVTRCAPLFVIAPPASLVVSVVGGATALLAGLIALTQFDLKRVLAYSTVSQLGYMFLGLGTGTLAGITAGMFHLFTHAFFKALLFLGSGSVMHAMGNVIDMRQFGGLRHRLPITHKTFAVGSLALAGLFPLAGFWSKDAILASVHDRAHVAQPAQHVSGEVVAENVASIGGPIVSGAGAEEIYQWLYLLGMGTTFLTAFYTFRAFFLTFYGPERIPPEAQGHAHESPPVMWWPLVILAVLSLVVGAFFAWTGGFASFLAFTPSLTFAPLRSGHAAEGFHMQVAVISTLTVLAGIGLAAFFYLGERHEIDTVRRVLSFDWLRGQRAFGWIDGLANLGPVRALVAGLDRLHLGWLARLVGAVMGLVLFPLAALVWLVSFLSPYRLSRDRFYIDEVYHALIVYPLRKAAQFLYAVDRWVIDGTVDLVGRVPGWLGAVLRPLQSGLLPFYGLAMALGVLILVLVRVVWGG